MRHRCAMLAGLLLLSACQAQSTRVIVQLDADDGVQAATQSLRVRVQLGGVPFRDEMIVAVQWPQIVVVEPLASAPSEDFELSVDAIDTAGQTIGSIRLHSEFVPNETRLARVEVSRGCRTVELDEQSLSSRDDPPVTPGVPCQRWQSPVAIDQPDLHEVSGPFIGATGNGTAIASWHDYELVDAETGTHAIWAARLHGGAWGAPERLASQTGPVIGSPPRFVATRSMAADRNGRAFVLWEMWDGEDASFSVRRFDGEGWTAASIVGGYVILYPPHTIQFVGSRSGTALFCSRMDNGRGGGASTSRFDGSTWNSLALQQGGYYPYPRPEAADCAIDEHGNAIAVWTVSVPLLPEEGFSPSQSFVGARWLDAGAADWGPQEFLDAAEPATGARVGLSNDGRSGIVTWNRGELGYFVRYERGVGWTRARELPVGFAADRLAVDDRGNALSIVEREGRVWSFGFDAASGEWSELGNLAAAVGGEAIDADFALEPGGRAVAAWIQPAETGTAVWATSFTPGAGWSNAERLDPDTLGDASVPRVAIDELGNAFVVWKHVADDGSSSVRTTRLEAP